MSVLVGLTGITVGVFVRVTAVGVIRTGVFVGSGVFVNATGVRGSKKAPGVRNTLIHAG